MAAARRFLWIALSVAAAVFAPVVATVVLLGAPTGDLVRIGAWSERDFGWRAPQPVLTVRGNREARDAAPDVLVLGDSFSMGNVWQSVLSDALALRTLSWGYDVHGCVDAFVDLALSGRYPSARHLVIETIERHLLDRFEAPQPCANGPALFEGPPGLTLAERARPWPQIDGRYLATAAWNAWRLRGTTAQVLRHGDTVNVPLERHDLFSNRRRDRLLYYAADDAKAGWTPERVAQAAHNALRLQRRVEAAGLTFTLVVVPDKSSVYRGAMPPEVRPAAGAPFLPVFERAGVHVLPLERRFEHSARTTVDFYLPDDTHLSSRGFEALGLAVAAGLASRSR